MLVLLHLGMRCWSVPLEVGKMHIELEKVGELIFTGCRDEVIILMKLLRPGHGRLLLHGGRQEKRPGGFCSHGEGRSDSRLSGGGGVKYREAREEV